MLRIIGPDGDHLALSDDVRGAVQVVRLGRRGRYSIEEIGAGFESPGHTSRNWGTVIKFLSGDIAVHPLPGPA
jgi:hypothetical protein